MLFGKNWSWSILFICVFRLCVWTPFAALLLPSELTHRVYTKDSAFSFGCEVIRPHFENQDLLGLYQELNKFILVEQQGEVNLRVLAEKVVRPTETKPRGLVFEPDSTSRQTTSDPDDAANSQ